MLAESALWVLASGKVIAVESNCPASPTKAIVVVANSIVVLDDVAMLALVADL